MSHIHIPDGVLPVWLWLAGWIAAVTLIGLAARFGPRGAAARRTVPLVGAVSALVLVTMSTEIVPIAYHINLTVVAGVLLGPWLGAISAFIVVLTLSLLGHGGITVVGLNTLMIATEMALGWALVRGGARLLGRARIAPVAGVATVLTLAMTTTLLVGVVALAGAGAATRDTGALDPETLEFRNPFSDGVIGIGLLGGGHDHEHEAEDDDAHDAEHDEADEDHGHAVDDDHGPALDVGRFAAVVYTLGPIGWLIEALVTAAILGYVARVRPALVLDGALTVEHRPRYGDEQGGH
jgi:cobalt/nickel transport system permease protein